MAERNEIEMNERREGLSSNLKQLDVKQLDENQDNLNNELIESPLPPAYDQVFGPEMPQRVWQHTPAANSRVDFVIPQNQVELVFTVIARHLNISLAIEPYITVFLLLDA